MASIIFENHGVILKFEREKYLFSKPNNFGTQGVLALLKNKKNGLKTFSLSSGGFVASSNKFKTECQSVHKAYKNIGGTISPLKINLKQTMPKCSFTRNNEGSMDMVEITYDSKKHRAFIFSGVLIKSKNHNINQYKKEFNQLAKGIAFNIEG